jgi:hypothetical protein
MLQADDRDRLAVSQPVNLYYRQNKYTLGNISIGWEQTEP